MITATRWHDFSYGHRVHGHEGKCCNLHGHNGRVHFTVRKRAGMSLGQLDKLGRVLDFSVINTLLCQWVEENWDHKFLVWRGDPKAAAVLQVDPTAVLVSFNPTAERMAEYLLYSVGPTQLVDTPCELVEVTLEETRKCSATVRLKV